MSRLIVALEADLHAGHPVGLVAPGVMLVDPHGHEYTPQRNKTQVEFWNLREEHMDAVADLADGAPVLVLENGDLTQGNKFTSATQYPLLADQIKVAVANISRWYDHPRINLAGVRIIYGTEVHNFDGGSAESLICDLLAAKYPAVPTTASSHKRIYLKQQDQYIDIAHHGGNTGSRKWLKGNTLRYYLRSTMMTDLEYDDHPARAYVRAHFHEYKSTQVRFHWQKQEIVSDIFVLPSYCGVHDHVRKVTRSKPVVHIGQVALEFNNTKMTYYPLYEDISVREEEEFDG